jgi:hypothetical protein
VVADRGQTLGRRGEGGFKRQPRTSEGSGSTARGRGCAVGLGSGHGLRRMMTAGSHLAAAQGGGEHGPRWRDDSGPKS